ncbi:TPA: restriction endonuclease subunit S [Enterococcus faecium]
MSKMKDSGIEWIGKVPQEWDIVRFKSKYRNIKEIAGEQSSKYERLALTLNGVIKRPKDDSEGLQPKEFDTYQILRENDFIFKMIDLQNISTSRVGLSPYTGLVSPAYIRFTSRKANQDNRFVYYYLMSMYYNCVFNSLGGDGVRSALNAKDMGQLDIPYPSEDEQICIANFLDNKCRQVDTLISNVQAQIEKLKAYKQSLITEVVTKGLDPTVPMKDSGVEWMGIIPAHWGVKCGKHLFAESDLRSADGSEELLTVSQYTGITPRSQKNVNMFEALSLEGYKICKVGDIAANTMWMWAGAIGVSQYYGVVSPSYNVYHQIGNAYLSKYLDYLLRIPPLVQCYESQSTGIRASRLRLYPQQFLNIRFPVPPYAEQEAVVAELEGRCEKVDRLIAIKQRKIDKLNEYKKSLIYECVTGKKEVPVG